MSYRETLHLPFQVDTPDVVAAILLEGLSDKKPKVPPACVGILVKALQLFGARAMPLKDLKTSLPGVLRICGFENNHFHHRFNSKVSTFEAWVEAIVVA